jgi:type I site-specific restriction-modification system R (restriction) subunit
MTKQVEKFTDFMAQMFEWSDQIREHGHAGIEQILDECEGDEKILKAILLFVMGMKPDLMELVNSYYSTGMPAQEEATDEGFFALAFDKFNDTLDEKFNEIYTLLDSGKSRQGLDYLIATGEAIETFGRLQLALLDDRSLSQHQYIFDAVASTKDSIDKLQEQVVTNDQDSILEEMIAFKKTSATLETHIQKILIAKL